MPTNQQSILNTLRDTGPEAWLAYLRPFEEGEPLLTGVSMQIVFHHAAPLAKEQTSLDWAEVAVRAAELDARDGNHIEREWSRLNA
jgi:hypothetical protein